MIDDKPFVSIIIPARNEEKFIERCLNSCLNQSYPKEKIEIIVVDGMSDDKTREIVKNYALNYPNIKLLDNPQIIAPSAMNIGIRESRGDIIVRVDGHCEIDPHFIENGVTKLLENEEIWAVGGPIETVGETEVAQAIAIAMSSKFGVGNSAFRTEKNKERYVDTVPFVLFHRWVFEKIGFYDESFVRTQDYELNLRIRLAGGKILLSPQLKAIYYSRSDIKSLFKQYFQYGFFKTRVMKKHKIPVGIRNLIPPISLIIFLAVLIASLFSNSFGFILILVVCYLTFLGVGTLSLLLRGIKYKIFLIPPIFAILHLSFSLGFLYGIFRFKLKEY